MSNNYSITGVNVLTVLVSRPTDKLKRNAFFDPYTRNITTTYRGNVEAIFPGYDAEDVPQVMVYPQRMPYGMNINYTFKETETIGEGVDFWIQDQYFNDVAVKTYYCYNCQAPNLYFSESKVVHFSSKQDLDTGESFKCKNPHCEKDFTYLGMVKIEEVKGSQEVL